MPLRGLFITGTDTGVGKTFVAAAIARRLREQGHRVGAYKPAVSGSEPGPDGPRWSDLEILSAAIGGDFSIDQIGPQRFHAPLAPPVAARLEGREVDADLLWHGMDVWQDKVDVLLVEGAGGLLSPLTDWECVADIARDMGFPLLIVARAGLGTINHTLLTVEAAASRELSIAGIVLNSAVPDGDDLSVATNAEELAKRCTVPVLGVLPHIAQNGDQHKPESPAKENGDLTSLALQACLSNVEDLLHADAFRRIDWFGLTNFVGAADGD